MSSHRQVVLLSKQPTVQDDFLNKSGQTALVALAHCERPTEEHMHSNRIHWSGSLG